MSVLNFIFDSLMTTALTLLVIAFVWIFILYVVGVAILTKAAFKYGLKKLAWFNPFTLLKYAGTKVTIYMGSGDLIVDYFGHFPKVTFISEAE